jgi:CubicO group peptidase (beta-lactamase class C family)
MTAGVEQFDVSTRAPTGLRDAAAGIVEAFAGPIADGFPPGGTLLVVDREGALLRAFAGAANVVGERVPTTRETIYDLASLTKVVVTVPLVVLFAQERRWRLDDPLAQHLPGYPRAATTLRQLLTHTSGLVWHREFYRHANGRDEMREAVFAEAASPDVTPGPIEYSDLNFMLLGWALEAVSGLPLDRLFAERIAAPLGMREAGFRPGPELQRRIAATELDTDQRLAPGLVWGEVHDGNAFAAGGVSGHAGLFAPADDVGRFASPLLRPEHHPVLDWASIAEMTRYQAGAPPDVRALGWRLDAGEYGSWPPSTYWHTGFTGTSLLVAPDAGIAVVLLLGGVHPARRLEETNEVRRAVHRRIADALR